MSFATTKKPRIIGDYSGQDAIDTLPKGKKSVKRKPVILQTKHAEAVKVLQKFDPFKSAFVTGFMVKCGTTDPLEMWLAIKMAMVTHPLIAEEFEKCAQDPAGFYGNSGTPALTSSSLKPPRATPPVTPHPASIAARTPPLLPLEAKSPKNLGQRASIAARTPASPEGVAGRIPAEWLRRPMSSTADMTSQYSRMGALGRGVEGMGNLLHGSGNVAGGGIGSALFLPTQIGTRATDALGLTLNSSEAADAGAGVYHDAFWSGANNAWAGLTGQDPIEVARRSGGEDLAAMRNRNYSNLRSQRPDDTLFGMSPDTQAGVASTLDEISDQTLNTAAIGGTGKLLSTVAPKSGKLLQGAAALQQAALNPAVSSIFHAVPEINRENEYNPLTAYGNAISNTDAYQHGATSSPVEQTPRAPAQTPQAPAQTPQAPAQTPQAPAQTPQAPAQTPQAPAQTPQAPTQPPVVEGPSAVDPIGPQLQPGETEPTYGIEIMETEPSEYDSPVMASLIADPASYAELRSTPEGAEAFSELTSSVQQSIEDPVTREAVETSVQSGQLDPSLEAAGQKNLAASGFGLEQVSEMWGKMTTMEQVGLALGLGVGAIGLISAFTGGGMGSWLAAILGIGAAGVAAGSAGAFGEGAQNMIHGAAGSLGKLFGAGESGEQPPALPGAGKGVAGAGQGFGKTNPQPRTGTEGQIDFDSPEFAQALGDAAEGVNLPDSVVGNDGVLQPSEALPALGEWLAWGDGDINSQQIQRVAKNLPPAARQAVWDKINASYEKEVSRAVNRAPIDARKQQLGSWLGML